MHNQILVSVFLCVVIHLRAEFSQDVLMRELSLNGEVVHETVACTKDESIPQEDESEHVLLQGRLTDIHTENRMEEDEAMLQKDNMASAKITGLQAKRNYAKNVVKNDNQVNVTSKTKAWSTLCNDPQPMGTGHGWWKQILSNSGCTCGGGWWPWGAQSQCYRDDGVKYCGADETSISMDMGEVGKDKEGCWFYATQGQKQWDINNVKKIEWDAEWENCDDLWLAPLSIFPGKWIPPQELSGEINFMESCKSHNPKNYFGTSLVCGDPDCLSKLYARQTNSNGVQHFSGTIDSATGTFTLSTTTSPNGSPEVVARYPSYTKKINYQKDFYLTTDIFNGGAGDNGWSGCGQANSGTSCRFVVANIQVTGNS